VKHLASFRCKVKIREGQARGDRVGVYGCNRWWWRTCGGTGVESRYDIL